MNDRLKKALDKVQAEEELKNNTKAFLYKKNERLYEHKNRTLPAFAPGHRVLSAGNIRRELALLHTYG